MSVTVVCAVFNQRADWLLEAVNSIADDALVSLGDDGSTDSETLRILDHFERMLRMNADRVRVTRFAHRGMEPTLNSLIEAADTKYIAILDSDDRRIEGALPEQCLYLDAHPEASATCGRFNYLAEDGTVIKANVLHPATPCHSSLVFRRDAWEQVGGYPTGFDRGQGDSFFIERLRAIGDVVALDILCAERRVHENSLSFPTQPRLQRILREHTEGDGSVTL